MTNIVHLFPDLTLEGAKAKIIENLKDVHQGKLVSNICVFKNLRDINVADKALHALIDENVVEPVKFPVKDKFDCPIMVTLYRYKYINT